MGTDTEKSSSMKWRQVALLGTGAMIALASCASAASGQAAGTTDQPSQTVVQTTLPVTSIDTTVVPVEIAVPGSPAQTTTAVVPTSPVALGDVSNEGVLAAAVIIVSDGDLEVAILEGLVTEAEAEAALLALESGTLSEYAN